MWGPAPWLQLPWRKVRHKKQREREGVCERDRQNVRGSRVNNPYNLWVCQDYSFLTSSFILFSSFHTLTPSSFRAFLSFFFGGGGGGGGVPSHPPGSLPLLFISLLFSPLYVLSLFLSLSYSPSPPLSPNTPSPTSYSEKKKKKKNVRGKIYEAKASNVSLNSFLHFNMQATY